MQPNLEFVLITGSIGMLLLTVAIVFFIYLFQRKILKKQIAYREIESLLKKQELQSAYALIQGQEQERKRIAEDLHDSIGGLLATLRMYSDLLQEKEITTELKDLTSKISELSELAAEETRRISHDLGSGILMHFGLATSLQQLCEVIQKSHHLEIQTTLDIQNEPDSTLSVNMYRIVQELFTNTLKHAHATKVRLEITEIENEYLTIIFEDNGSGFDVDSWSDGMGIQNIKTRAERFQGTVTIDSNVERGTTVIIEIPFQK